MKNNTKLLEEISYLTEVLLDDLNTPKLLARLRAGQEAIDEDLARSIKYLDDHVLKLGLFEDEKKEIIPDYIHVLARQRRQAKWDKDYATADSIKTQIIESGYEVKDGKDGYEIVKG